MIAVSDLRRRVQVEDGTSNAPSLSFSNDLNTGMYRPAADTLALATNGVERMRLTSTGNIGIGTTNPQALLHLEGTLRSGHGTFITNPPGITAASTLSAVNGSRTINLVPHAAAGSYNNATAADDSLLWFSNGTMGEGTLNIIPWANSTSGIRLACTGHACKIQMNGTVGIGTTNPQAPLHVANGNLLTSATHKSTRFYAPPNWSYSSTTLNQWVQLWSFTFNAPVQGIATISVAGHWQHSITNNYAYMGILVNNSHVNASGLYDSFTQGGASIQGGYPHHYWSNVSSWATFSHTCSVKLNAGNNTIGLGSFHAAGTATYNGVGVSMQFTPLYTM